MKHEAIRNTHPNVKMIDDGEGAFDKNGNSVTIDETKVAEEIKRLEAEYDSKKYQRDRLAEYPSIQELVVALYDADDKAEIDKKRAEIKKKYPKPE
tara:strand:- start:4070 stop:4357 length:288 start_codon:yes stop_codon:yes gene_type:complete